MITSSSIPYISQMLNDPRSITDADIDSIVSLTETFPYFVPARYMEAAGQHKNEPFNPHMMNTMQLYMDNWVMFHEYMQAAHDNGSQAKPAEKVVTAKAPVAQPVPQPVPADADDSSEESQFREDIDFWSQDEEDEDNYTAHEEDEEVAVVEAEDEEVEEDTADTIGEEFYEEESYDEEETLDGEETVAEGDDEEVYSATPTAENDEALILPIYTEDYFLHQGIQVSNNIPAVDKINATDEQIAADAEAAKSLMIVMSYTEWLMHFKTTSTRVREEEEDQKALKTMWQKEKLAAALEEENEEIPENVFEMAVNSITREDDLASQSLADIYAKQGKYDAAMDMYKKLSLRNPQKSAYFARKIEEILKEKQS